MGMSRVFNLPDRCRGILQRACHRDIFHSLTRTQGTNQNQQARGVGFRATCYPLPTMTDRYHFWPARPCMHGVLTRMFPTHWRKCGVGGSAPKTLYKHGSLRELYQTTPYMYSRQSAVLGRPQRGAPTWTRGSRPILRPVYMKKPTPPAAYTHMHTNPHPIHKHTPGMSSRNLPGIVWCGIPGSSRRSRNSRRRGPKTPTRKCDVARKWQLSGAENVHPRQSDTISAHVSTSDPIEMGRTVVVFVLTWASASPAERLHAGMKTY